MYLLHAYYFSEDKLTHYSIIVLGVSTLGTSVLLWWLYKELAKQFSGKDKYDLEGNTHLHYIYLRIMCMYLCMYVCMYVCMCVQYLYVCKYVRMYVYNIKFTYTAHSAVPQSSTKSSKKYVIVATCHIHACMHACMYM